MLKKKVDSQENVEEEYNVKKSLKSCKSPLQKNKSCNKNQEKSYFLLLTKMIILINIHMKIKPILGAYRYRY